MKFNRRTWPYSSYMNCLVWIPDPRTGADMEIYIYQVPGTDAYTVARNERIRIGVNCSDDEILAGPFPTLESAQAALMVML